MKQKCSYMKVLEIFFKGPITAHFIREISREIHLAPTSVRKNIKELERENLIVKKELKPFPGFIANRENEEFIYLKRAYNLATLLNLKKRIEEELSPKAIVLFGSYSRGEDIETSDIDLVCLSKIEKEINLNKIENELKRKINIMFIKDLKQLEESILKKINNGIILAGEI